MQSAFQSDEQTSARIYQFSRCRFLILMELSLRLCQNGISFWPLKWMRLSITIDVSFDHALVVSVILQDVIIQAYRVRIAGYEIEILQCFRGPEALHSIGFRGV